MRRLALRGGVDDAESTIDARAGQMRRGLKLAPCDQVQEKAITHWGDSPTFDLSAEYWTQWHDAAQEPTVADVHGKKCGRQTL